MNIAHLLPATARFPLKKHNGRYEWALRLARIQAEQGHEVTIYCGGGYDEQNQRLQFKSYNYDFQNKALNNSTLIKTAFFEEEHDIFHSHFDYLHYFLADMTSRPVVSTQHWFPGDAMAEASKLNRAGNAIAVPVTDFMASENRRLDIPSSEPIYHGIDLDLFQPVKSPERKRFLTIGRIAPHKGTLEAVKIAKSANIELDIIGKINNSDMDYWKEIEPLVDGVQIRYLGTKSRAELRSFYANAKALLFPSPINEAFGQVTIETQACGTPVITSSTGTSKELVDDGLTGFTCTAEEDYISAIYQIDSIDSAACRKKAENYDLKRMVNQYEELYKNLLLNAK